MIKKASLMTALSVTAFSGWAQDSNSDILLNLVDECFFAFPFSTEVMFLILQFCNFLIQLLNLRLVILALDGLRFSSWILEKQDGIHTDFR